MELIHPAEISGKIMTLIDQARSQLIIVSPYNKFTYWKKLTQRIEKARNRGVNIRWYIRKNVDNNVEQIRQIGIEPIEIENLHCKLYLNEHHAVVTSMNLHEYSDSSSIDIGYLITEKYKYQELTNFIDTYINNQFLTKNKLSKKTNDRTKKVEFTDSLFNFLLNCGFKKENLKVYKGRYGVVVTIEKFATYFSLILEPRSGYYRVDLRTAPAYKLKKDVYGLLKTKEYELHQLIGFKIDFGNQMKRLKLDLSIFENYQYENWNDREFNKLKPILETVIEVYKEQLEKILQTSV